MTIHDDTGGRVLLKGGLIAGADARSRAQGGVLVPRPLSGLLTMF